WPTGTNATPARHAGARRDSCMRLLDVRVRRSRPDRLGATRSWTVRPLEFRHCAQADKQRLERLGAIDNRAVEPAIGTVGHAVPHVLAERTGQRREAARLQPDDPRA